MAQFSDSPDLVSENGDGRHANAILVPRDQDLTNYVAAGAPMMAPMWQDQGPGGMSVTKMLHSFRRRWMLALFVGLMLGLPAALATWLIFPKQYEVDAMLQFRNVEALLGDDGRVNPNTTKNYRETQLHLIKSHGILTATLREPKVSNLAMIRAEDEPIYFLQKSISAYSPRDSDLIMVTMKGEDPREMVEIVRTLTEKYLKLATDEAGSIRNNRIELLKNWYDKNEEERRKANDAYVELARRMGAADSAQVTTQKQQLQQEIYHLENRLTTIESNKSLADQQVAKYQATLESFENNEFPEALLENEIRSDPEMMSLNRQLAEIKEIFDHSRSVAKNPRFDQAVARNAERLRTMLETKEQLAAQLREIARAKLQFGEENPTVGLRVAQTRADSLAQDVATLKAQISVKNNQVLSLSQDSADLSNLQAERERLRASNADLNRRLTDAYLQVSLPPPIELVEPADEPEGSTLMYRVILTSFLGVLCFCVGLAGVVLLEYTKQRVSTLNEIGYGGLGIRVLGTVPNLARLSRAKNGEANGAVSGILAESIDSVRTMLLSNKRADAPKVILVTSADEHEGKTTVASHLAASLARAGRRTLLVDGDLRKPAIHMLFDMPLSAGLCEVLRGEAEIDAVIHPAQVEGMWLMLAGQCDQGAIASLAKENAEAVFRTLRADYDFVVVDTGPALAFADTMLMGSHADAAVMSILRDVSQIPKVYEARERLEAIGVQVLGGVVGGVSQSGNRSYALMN